MLQTLYKLQSFISRLVYLRAMIAAFALVIFVSGTACAPFKPVDFQQNAAVKMVYLIATLPEEWILLVACCSMIGLQVLIFIVRLNSPVKAAGSFYAGKNAASVKPRAKGKISLRRSSSKSSRNGGTQTTRTNRISRNKIEESLDGAIN